MSRRPERRVMEKAFDFREHFLLEEAIFLRHFQDVPPSCEIMQFNTELLHELAALWEDVIVEDDKAVIDIGPGPAKSLAEINFASPVRCKVLDKEGAGARNHLSLDLRITAESLSLFPH